MKIAVVSLFPEMFKAITESGISRRAFEREQVTLQIWNPRDFTQDKHQTVDDRPYGVGPGMVMMAEPLCTAIRAAKDWAGSGSKVIYLSPQGEPLKQQRVTEFSAQASLVLVSGRYEGIDERVLNTVIDQELSIGDYVLSGGELPAMVLIDALLRLLPGALGDDQSAQQDSFTDGLLDWPHYTRPDSYGGLDVPAVLMSGNHAAIQQWRLKQALGKTWQARPDLLDARQLTSEEQKLLDEFKSER